MWVDFKAVYWKWLNRLLWPHNHKVLILAFLLIFSTIAHANILIPVRMPSSSQNTKEQTLSVLSMPCPTTPTTKTIFSSSVYMVSICHVRDISQMCDPFLFIVKNGGLKILLEAFGTWVDLGDCGVHYRVIWLECCLGSPLMSAPLVVFLLVRCPREGLFIHLKDIYWVYSLVTGV